jgi:hypothetical protein
LKELVGIGRSIRQRSLRKSLCYQLAEESLSAQKRDITPFPLIRLQALQFIAL